MEKVEKKFLIDANDYLFILTYEELFGALKVLKQMRIEYRVMDL